MKRLQLFFFLFLVLGLQSQEKYAVLITGDYAAKLSDIPADALWNGGEDLKTPMMEFWNDTYLMWELLKSKGYSDENIFILFADGNDFARSMDRYTPPTGVTLTDYAANRSNVINLFENLYKGTGGIPKNTMNNPTTCYNDSLFASIDLNYLYKNLGLKNTIDWQNSTDALLSSLPRKTQHVSLETLWTDVVTFQPEGFVINEDGNVSITSGEGLAWLISTVNGLNGQEANDYKDVTVTLENDVNITENSWVAIGSDENPFRGTFNGQGFYIHGINMNDAMEGRKFGLFGYLDNAEVKDVKLGKGQIFGYEDCGGIAYIADNNTVIDRCIVRTEMAYGNYSGGIVGINKDSKISNCALIPERFEGAMICVGGIAGQNISTNSDAIIENCFVSTVYVSSYSTEYAGGIVGKNITEGDNHKAIIRNCYAAPMNMYGHSGGVAAYNSGNSLIENSYYTIVNGSEDYTLYEENNGVVINCSLFNENLQFGEIVEVNGENETNLLDALNKWVSTTQNSQYLPWVIVEDTNYGYPIFETMLKDFTNTDVSYLKNISVYPNPAKDLVKISLDSGLPSVVKIYNIMGIMLDEIEVNSNEMEINVSDYAPGVYFFNVEGDVVKVIKN